MKGWYAVTERLSDVKYIGNIYFGGRVVASVNGPDLETTEKNTLFVMKSLRALTGR